MMKQLLLPALLWLAASGFAAAQTTSLPANAREPVFFAKYGNPDWLVIKDGVQVTTDDFLRGHLSDLGLGPDDALRLYRSETDDLGITHHRYEQYHQGVKVDGAELLIHEKNGFVRTLNGKLVRGLRVGIDAKITKDQAIGRALQHLPAQKYMWQVPQAEAMLKRIDKNPNATFYPQPELVLVHPEFGREADGFQPAWSLEVYAERPQLRRQVYVDAVTGKVLCEQDLLTDQNTPGTAETKYSGTRTIITDSIAPGEYRLVESTRGGGIETYNLNRTTDHGGATDFTDDDNFWNNITPQFDEVATDVHWGSEMTFDYYLDRHNYSGIDGKDMPFIGYVHYDYFWSNAQWTGKWAQFGDGDGTIWGPLTSLDVVGHEFTHGVTGNTARLRYQNESGALNESFSDIFGTLVEFFADPDHGDYLVGEDFVKVGKPLRSMENPKEEDNPDTYKGEFWAVGNSDNGGVHTNSGVQNYWFYLLSHGGSSVNDNDDPYDVTGLGLEAAGAISFRNLRYYLVQLSDYADARQGSLQAAEDLYGICSPEVLETAKAWHAVGVGSELLDTDLRLINIVDPAPTSCGLVSGQKISVRFRYNGCLSDLEAGTKIPMAYQIDNQAIVWDTLTLGTAISAGDTISFTFSQPTDVFATAGKYWLSCWAGLGADIDPANNSVSLNIETIPEQNVDMRLDKVSNLSSGCFLGAQSPGLDFSFNGCDSLPAGEPIILFYSVNGADPVAEAIPTPKTLYRGDVLHHDFTQLEDFSAKGRYSIDAWLEYGPDYLNANDSVQNYRVVNPALMYKEDVLSFENGEYSLDSMYSAPGAQARGFLSAGAAKTGAFGFEITGGNIQQAFADKKVQFPTKDNVWNINQDFRSKTCICADLSNLVSADLRFSRKQTYSDFYRAAFGYNMPYASAMRILVNDEPVGSTFKPVTHNLDAWQNNKVSLNDFVGNVVEICFQTHTGLDPAFDSTGVGDRVLLDNITITGVASSATYEPGRTPEWRILPNPGTGLFYVSYPADGAETLHVEVLDALGRSVLSQIRQVNAGNNSVPLRLEGRAPGVYLLRIDNGRDQATTRKLVVR